MLSPTMLLPCSKSLNKLSLEPSFLLHKKCPLPAQIVQTKRHVLDSGMCLLNENGSRKTALQLEFKQHYILSADY